VATWVHVPPVGHQLPPLPEQQLGFVALTVAQVPTRMLTVALTPVPALVVWLTQMVNLTLTQALTPPLAPTLVVV
jgi:hypothetical protein